MPEATTSEDLEKGAVASDAAANAAYRRGDIEAGDRHAQTARMNRALAKLVLVAISSAVGASIYFH